MTKCNENMTPGYRKSGYLKVGRNVLKAFSAVTKNSVTCLRCYFAYKPLRTSVTGWFV